MQVNRFMRRSGNLIVDNSQFISYQIQHSTEVGKLALTYGADAYLTRPKTLKPSMVIMSILITLMKRECMCKVSMHSTMKLI